MNGWSYQAIFGRLAAFIAMTNAADCSVWAQAVESDNMESAAVPVDFARDILPLFESHCVACHGPGRQESGYRLDLRDVALGTADFGDPPIVPGNSAHSPLVEFISGNGELIMPPQGEGQPLQTGEVELIRRWIDLGADWPDELAGDINAELTTDHWSFQPLVDSRPPMVDVESLARFPVQNEIDQFVISRLNERGLDPSAPADRITLIRRMYLDMHGLYPTPGQVREFVGDSSPQAIDHLIDSVLSSPHYGERWARHWLDVVRFGESTGYEVNRDRANAWVYRDYVIEALNTDKSYRDFVMEQLAGDALGVDEATGFLVGGSNDIVKSPDIGLTLMQRQDELADYVNTTATTFLGLTIGCARCHNHKFDPILQQDYFSMQAIFAGVEHGERKMLSRANPELNQQIAAARAELNSDTDLLNKIREVTPPPDPAAPDALEMVNAKHNSDEFAPITARFLRFTIFATNQFEPCLDELEVYSVNEQRNVAASLGTLVASSGNYPGNPIHQLPHVNDGKYGNEFSWISNTAGSGWIQFEFPEPVTINRVDWGRDRNGVYADRLATEYTIAVSDDGQTWQTASGSSRRKPYLIDGREPEDAFIARLSLEQAEHARTLLDRIRQLRQQLVSLEQSIPTGYVGVFRAAEPVHLLYRGDPMAPRQLVKPDTLTVMGSLELDEKTDEQSRRLALARWIVSDKNPLTARVIVNRVWHYHFGRGLVATTSDFGQNGSLPSHPELLDWLALRLMENNWSLKWLHREILRSATWQQSSVPRPQAIAVDADDRLLWRFPPRRLEAEAIRDCVLQLSGKLNPEAGGPGFLLFRIDRENVHHYFPLDEFQPEHYRRMIYMTKIRQEQDDVFGVFDCPDGGQAIPDRTQSTTALQALNLLNSPFMLQQAEFLAERLVAGAGADSAKQIELAYQLAFSRLPTSAELEDAVAFVRHQGLESFCRALLNASEFVFLS